MKLIVYLDESGTHDQSPISVMAGYVGTAAQWERFGQSWSTLLISAGIQHVHAVDLFKRTKQFKGWTAGDVNAFAVNLDGIIAAHLQLGFSVVVRDDDYRTVYRSGAPTRLPQDSKYGVCFRGSLAFAPSYIASELKALADPKFAQGVVMDFVLEDGHRNVGDARRLFTMFKADALDEWRELVGTFDVVKKPAPGAQAADFLAYCVYRAELLEHGENPSAIERSSYVADTPLVTNTYPRAAPSSVGPILYRIPVSRDVLRSLKKKDLVAQETDRIRPAPIREGDLPKPNGE
jgi:hypothetical protein